MVNPNDNEIKNLMWLMNQREYWLLREDGEQRIGTITGTIGPIIADIEININTDQEYSKITITEDVKLITPGAYRILGNPFTISVERVVPNE